ncbi:rhodopsin, GQ-coupled-like [Stylophora pistillata]|uniref:rhodopsin, GQ-coupled-like n=1 Tax=Stylophora pistillata TaxID=50429 RepID=UPI000C03BC88|nr:rhodopsin, GQ-coupled-like [Stylophora pistillata]
MTYVNMTSNEEIFRGHSIFWGYGLIMFLILLFGFFGNLFTIIVLRHQEHRKKSITPLMVNLAVADLMIVVLGYPPVINTNISGQMMRAGGIVCIYSGFINGMTGITSIGTLTAMSGVVYQTIKRNNPNYSVSRRKNIVLIAGTWLYGIVALLPPSVGWNRFVPGKAGVSCAPDWTTQDLVSTLYIVLLVTGGFLIPFILITTFLTKTLRLLKRFPVPFDPFILAQRRRYQQRTLLMITATMGAFLLSWSPYCIVSFAATIKGHHILTPGEAEIPELMAKASVVYNPIIYMIMNERFRRTLRRTITGNKTPIVAPDQATDHNFIVSMPRNIGRENNLNITTTAEISTYLNVNS